MTGRPGRYPSRVVATALVLASVLLLATAGVATGQDGPTIRITDVDLVAGESGTVNVSIHGLEDGLAGYRMMVTTSNASVATITDVTHTDELESTADPEFAPDNSSVNVSAPDRYRNVQPGHTDVELYTLTVEAGEEAGEAEIDVAHDQIDPDQGEQLDPSVDAGLVTVDPRPTVTVPDAELAPGESTTLEVTVEDLADGLSDYRMRLGVPAVGPITITNATYPDALAPVQDPRIGPDGANVTVAAEDVDGAVEPGDSSATLLRLTVEAASAEGDWALGVREHEFTDDDGETMAMGEDAGQLSVRTPDPLEDENALRLVLMISIGGVVVLVAGFVRLVGIG